MTVYFYKPITERINNYGCTIREVAWLVDLFAYEVIKRLGSTTKTEAHWDNLEGFYGAKQRHIDHFNLKVERKNIGNKEQWLGVFKHDSKILEVITTIEKD